jgi:hypothetical protein
MVDKKDALPIHRNDGEVQGGRGEENRGIASHAPFSTLGQFYP